MPRELIYQKFESLVIRRDGCWGWRGCCSGGNGKYACFGYARSVLLAHRVSWEIVHGRMPPRGMDVMHLCHNPICSNPAHLALGTRAENMRTSQLAGRLQRRIPRADMPAVIAARAAGASLRSIGLRYGCTKQAVRHMLISYGAA